MTTFLIDYKMEFPEDLVTPIRIEGKTIGRAECTNTAVLTVINELLSFDTFDCKGPAVITLKIDR